MTERGDQLVALAERVFALLDEGAFSTTYKHALLLAILDLCFEKTHASGEPPQSLTTRELAEKVLALYWPQALPWDGGGVLRQAGGRRAGQAEILTRIIRFRQRLADGPSHPLHRVRLNSPASFEALLRFVEWKLVELPIPRLQRIGQEEHRFLYEYAWSDSIRSAQVSAYQSAAADAFDNRLVLKPGVAEGLIALNNLLRPLIQREWLRRVQRYNADRVAESGLEAFLFGREREPLQVLSPPLRALQQRRCFYCQGLLAERCEVDHFIPWSRYPNNAVQNLVVACAGCNGNKRDFLAGSAHVEAWTTRNVAAASELDEVARRFSAESAGQRTHSVAVALYLPMPDEARLWLGKGSFEAFHHGQPRILRALRAV
jgi:5-methylcytosine-specific restriction endonuclease McrA